MTSNEATVYHSIRTKKKLYVRAKNVPFSEKKLIRLDSSVLHQEPIHVGSFGWILTKSGVIS